MRPECLLNPKDISIFNMGVAKKESTTTFDRKSFKKAFSFQSFKEAFFSLDSSPHKKALSFAVGIFIAFNPTYGLHTVEVFFVVWLFRLNFPLVFAGAWLNNPWTVLPVSTFCYLVGRGVMKPFGLFYDPNSVDRLLHILMHTSWKDWLSTLPPILMHEGIPFVIGSLLVGSIAAVVTYFVSLFLLLRFQSLKGSGKKKEEGF
jgi:uncharacterized protein (DUF2062 family)